MKKLLLGTILLVSTIVAPIPTMARVNVSIGISLPPPLVFQAPPDVIVLPETDNVYVVPYIDADMFFWDGWWWRLWDGRWYRSHYYDRGWYYYGRVPSFYFDVDPGWRRYYREHSWHGHQWNYERIPDRRLRQNWRSWRSDKYWERRGTWGVQGYQHQPHQQRQELRHKRQEQYQQRPEVRRHQQQMREQQRHPRVQQRQHPQQHSQPRGQQHRKELQHKKSQGEHERGDREHGR
jgi:hypothetical protein